MKETVDMNGTTDFDIELRLFDQDLAQLSPKAAADPMSADYVTKFLYRSYQRASLGGDLTAFQEVESRLDTAIAQLGPAPDLCLLKANLDFKLHRLKATKRDLAMAEGLTETTQGKAIVADVVFQEGLYEEAQQRYEGLIAEERTWDNLARLAHLRARMGDLAGAEGLYVEAEDELTAKEMRSFAWLELQRGLLHLKHGEFAKARERYDRANRAYSGYWLIEEHFAGLLAAEHRVAEAVAAYRNVLRRVPKPEAQQALGNLYRQSGQDQEAELCFQEALASYLRSAERGDVHYYHHLVDFYSDVRHDGEEALKWARKDLEVRNNPSTQAAVAWALHLTGRNAEAQEMIDHALGSGVQDPGLFMQAGKIHSAAGEHEHGEHYLKLAAKLNPHYSTFHVHH
jgi:tetratricopeptide (TPR) repeat protein